MSTYLLAFMVLEDFNCVEGGSARGVVVFACAPSIYAGSLEYPLSVGLKVVDFIANLYGLPYPLHKMHLVAIPDFAAGAMENLGLITFAPLYMLVDPLRSSASNVYRAATTVAHEIAHQWHGNLVTMAWWNDLWLNEAFATFHEYISTVAAEPDWELQWAQMYAIDANDAMAADALASSRRIVPPLASIVSPGEIDEMFDAITYSKGGCVLRMLQAYADSLHTERPSYFADRVSFYLERHKYASATTANLVSALDDSGRSRFPTADMVASWTSQAGFPLLTVTVTASGITVRQQRYLSDPGAASGEAQAWMIPLSVTVEGAAPVTTLLPAVAESSVPLSIPPGQWVKVNVGQTVLARVRYSAANLLAIAAALQSRPSLLEPIDRAGLLGDAVQLMRSGHVNVSAALQYTHVLQGETDATVWAVAKQHLLAVSRILSGARAPTSGQFDQYIGQQMAPRLAGLALTGRGTLLSDSLRASLLAMAITLRVEPTLSEAVAMFQTFRESGSWASVYTRLAPDVVALCTLAAVQEGGMAEWTWAAERRAATTSADEREWLLLAMAASRNEAVVAETLNYALTSDQLRPQDRPRLVASVARNPFGVVPAWALLKAQWAALDPAQTDSFVLASVVRVIVSSLPAMQAFYNDAKAFFASAPVIPGSSQAVEAGLAQLQANANWLATHGNELAAFLSSQ
eukprot:Unigene6717_Nuclearia_a/m.20604 Unigene6717_Nuclearia_a/g.20604  ORF Unigene6717_Nuclearia_a/g.20604 Unigene6717_Nuclearia_a/m.20604 type:complete len:689 (+) Unigene6717_Nuclearia_a:1-2067(+)